MGRRAPGALFEEARVSLEEEDVVEEVERERTEVEEGRYEAPILSLCQSGVCLRTENVECVPGFERIRRVRCRTAGTAR